MDYDLIARSYNKLYEEEQLNKLRIISTILKVDNRDKLLDIGNGTGISTNYFKCKSYGIDSSLKMLKQGKGKLVNALAENLPLKDKTFDIIISVTSFHNFLDFDKAIEEVKRVGKNNCKLVITLLKKSKNFKLIEELLLRNFKLKQIDEAKDTIFYGNV